MALVNALLVQWSGGTLWVTDAGSIASEGRREGFVQVGQASSEQEAARMANAILATRLTATVEINAGVEPAGGDTPYVDYQLGDTLTVPNEDGAPTAMEVREFTVTTDDDGEPVYSVAFNAVHAVQEARIVRWLKRMAHGSLAGTVHSASPLPLPPTPPRQGAYRTLDAWSWTGSPPLPSLSPAQKPEGFERVVGLNVTITGTTTGDTTGEVYVNQVGATYATLGFSFPAGSAGGLVMIDPTLALSVDGTLNETLQLHLTAAPGTDISVAARPIFG